MFAVRLPVTAPSRFFWMTSHFPLDLAMMKSPVSAVCAAPVADEPAGMAIWAVVMYISPTVEVVGSVAVAPL